MNGNNWIATKQIEELQESLKEKQKSILEKKMN